MMITVTDSDVTVWSKSVDYRFGRLNQSDFLNCPTFNMVRSDGGDSRRSQPLIIATSTVSDIGIRVCWARPKSCHAVARAGSMGLPPTNGEEKHLPFRPERPRNWAGSNLGGAEVNEARGGWPQPGKLRTGGPSPEILVQADLAEISKFNLNRV
jgi:hypothetical protein